MLPGSSPIAASSPSSKAHQKSGPFPPPALPGLSGTMTLSDSRPNRRLTRRRGRDPRPSGSPQLRASPFRRAVPNYPGGSGRVRLSVASPSRAAFPVSQAGRHPRRHFRGLLRLHSRYGPPDCSTARGGLGHEASTRPVAQPGRSSATRANRQLSGWNLPPLVKRAIWAH